MEQYPLTISLEWYGNGTELEETEYCTEIDFASKLSFLVTVAECQTNHILFKLKHTLGSQGYVIIILAM